jgi:hypothetical protein
VRERFRVKVWVRVRVGLKIKLREMVVRKNELI